MLKSLRRVSLTDVAYVSLLLAFVALGTFVYALAAGSALAGLLGAGMVVLFAASVAAFRVGARRRAESNDSGIEIDGANVWIRPLRRDQIDQYLLSYRGVQKSPALTVVAAAPTASVERRAA